jgi:hypothetical protein
MDLHLKPPKPPIYYGERDAAKLEGWIFQVENYFKLYQSIHPNEPVTDSVFILFASNLLRGAASTWWQIIYRSNQVPEVWIDFVRILREQFLPVDAHQAARDKLHILKQTKSVAAYATSFQDVCLMLPGLTEDEKKDRFIRGLKPNVRVEVLKSSPQDYVAATRVALAVDNAIFSTRAIHFPNQVAHQTTHAPMEIGKLAGSSKFVAKRMTPQVGIQGSPKTRWSSMNLPKSKQCFRCGSTEHYVAGCPHPAPKHPSSRDNSSKSEN